MTVKSLRLTSTLFVSALSINSAMALPIDWTGVFGVDTHNISNTCRTSDAIGEAQKPLPGDATGTGVRTGTQALRNGDCGATFQTYTMRLNPNIIVNDGVTLKGELSSGYLRGGFAGDDSANNYDGSGNNAYFFTTPAQRSALNVNQMYMELYADTALVKIGRFARGFGMGMIFDDGRDPWDRFLTMYDGIDAEMKIGNFSVAPYYAKISSYNDTKNKPQGQPVGDFDVRELGLVAKYDNKNKDFIASILYAKRSSEAKNSLYNSTTDGSTPADAEIDRGKTDITIIDGFVSKKWNKFKVTAEAALMTGDYGQVYAKGDDSKISASSGVVDLKYDLNPKWDMGFLAGQASGDKGSSDKFEAAYMHPNFQIADLMFRYNYAAFNEGGKSIFDSSITNARFFKLYGNYKTDKWTWKGALIMANALETAKAGSPSYHHEENYRFDSDFKQDKNYGWEIDLGFDYRWNPNVTIGGYYGYWMVGDYYAFTNAAKELSLSNVHGGGLRATLEF
ncbi:hypothetical protein [Peredibacter starrii]|uniref:Uncharacterized protein n=1 Tax=Peredibacter starrii TaxID=28202 RepID=A0AAX4HQF9_9BACT|nr:hypothetical protein [Peredibacter starrii]WPU65356.1 hypothetical protein SOO65_01195 [Peredibacter starrii]